LLSIALVPVASTTTFASIRRGASPLRVTTTPVAFGRSSVSDGSSRISLTFASCQTVAPCSAALSRSISSNRLRSTCHVCEQSRGSRSSK
jgi:hypothetical protein